MKKYKHIGLLLGALIITQLTGFAGSLFNVGTLDTWYAELIRPSFAPPNWVFGPVWFTLFFMMGVALYRVAVSGKKSSLLRPAYTWFGIQLALNIAWSALFFGLQNPLYALIDIIALIIAIFLTIHYFYKVDKPAAYLLLPYIGWVSFASLLNFAFWMLNR
jgi:tryptophan-rich sensory protein